MNKFLLVNISYEINYLKVNIKKKNFIYILNKKIWSKCNLRQTSRMALSSLHHILMYCRYQMTEDLEEGELVSEEVKVNQPIQTKKGRKSQQSTSNKNARRNIASTRHLKLMKVQTGAKKIPFGSYEVIFLM